MVVAQLAELSLTTPEDPGLNLVKNCIEKDKRKIEAVNGPYP